jgi:MFS family permease
MASGVSIRAGRNGTAPSDRYKWIALSNVTLGVLLATLDGSIVLIAMPSIFRGIHLDPLVPQNSFYLLWMILGFLVVTSVLIVSFGRLGDMFGRVRMYNLGFVVYTLASLALTIDWMTGPAGAIYLIAFRLVQGVGAAFVLANSAAILTDAFPANQRGMALGINNIVGVSGMFVGLVLGGILAPLDWRLVFLISVPVGLFGTVWAYLKLEERSKPRRASVDWLGNLTFALGLVLIMVSVTYGIRPYGDHATGWGSPRVIALLGAGAAFLVVLVTHEHVDHNGVEAIGGSPEILRATAGRLPSPIGEVTGIASEHDERAGTERGANTIFVFDLGGLRVGHLGDLGQHALREEQAEAIGEIDLLFVPVGGGPTIGSEQAGAIVGRLAPQWAVPMHYRTHRIGFLETAEAFLERSRHVEILPDAVFETDELPRDDGPLVVVPAAP